MSEPLKVGDVITAWDGMCVTVQSVTRSIFRGTDLVTGSFGGWMLYDENVEWIRGEHTPQSAPFLALQAAHALRT